MTTTTLTRPDASERIERLNRASLRKVIDPDRDLPGGLGDGQVLPDELLSIHELPEFQALTPDQRATLAREELASVVEAGLRFEAVLMAGFALEVFADPDLTDPRVVYSLHEIGEETRHSRLFSRLLTQVGATATNPLNRIRRLELRVVSRLIRRPATLDVLVLGGEEIPDLLQKLAADHPDTDPFVQEVNRYHRAEEARHLAFARTVLGEKWAATGRVDRFLVRQVVPRLIKGMFEMIVHPGVYATVGLPRGRRGGAPTAPRPASPSGVRPPGRSSRPSWAPTSSHPVGCPVPGSTSPGSTPPARRRRSPRARTPRPVGSAT